MPGMEGLWTKMTSNDINVQPGDEDQGQVTRRGPTKGTSKIPGTRQAMKYTHDPTTMATPTHAPAKGQYR